MHQKSDQVHRIRANMESLNVTREEVESFLSVTSREYCCSSDVVGLCEKYGNVFDCGGHRGTGSGSGLGCGDGDLECSGRGYKVVIDRGACFLIYPGEEDIKTLNGHIVDFVGGKPTIITLINGIIAEGYIVGNDLTLNPCYLVRVGNTFTHGSTLEEAILRAGLKVRNRKPIEQLVQEFVDEFGTLDSRHKGMEYYVWHCVLTYSSQFMRDLFCRVNKIDLNQLYTVRQFLQMTANVYGGDVIRDIIAAYFSQD